MVFSRTWDAAYEANPPNTQQASQGALRIEELKTDTRERAVIDHQWGSEAGPTNESGTHKKVSLKNQGSDPATLATFGYLYTKLVAGFSELFWRDDTSAAIQLTSGGKLALFGTVNTWTKGNICFEFANGNHSGSWTPDFNNGNAQRVDVTGNITVQVPSNGVKGCTLSILIAYSGAYTLGFSASIYKSPALVVTATSISGHGDLAVFYYNGTNWALVAFHTDIYGSHF